MKIAKGSKLRGARRGRRGEGASVKYLFLRVTVVGQSRSVCVITRTCNGGAHTSCFSIDRQDTPRRVQRRRKSCGNEPSSLLSTLSLSLPSPCSSSSSSCSRSSSPSTDPYVAVIEVGTKPVGKFQLSLPSSSTRPGKPIARLSLAITRALSSILRPCPSVLALPGRNPAVAFGRTLFNGGQLSISSV